MAFDAYFLTAVLDEIREKAIGARVEKIHQPSRDTVILLLRKPSRENGFIACSVIVLLITSLLDCHFFNLGPVLFYSATLAFAERQVSFKLSSPIAPG